MLCTKDPLRDAAGLNSTTVHSFQQCSRCSCRGGIISSKRKFMFMALLTLALLFGGEFYVGGIRALIAPVAFCLCCGALFAFLGPVVRQVPPPLHSRFNPLTMFWKTLSYCVLGTGLWFVCMGIMQMAMVPKSSNQEMIHIWTTMFGDVKYFWLLGSCMAICLNLMHLTLDKLTVGLRAHSRFAVTTWGPVVVFAAVLYYLHPSQMGLFAAPFLGVFFVAYLSKAAHRASGWFLNNKERLGRRQAGNLPNLSGMKGREYRM